MVLQDKATIAQVLGSLIKNPSLLAETDKYKLDKSDFPEKFHQMIFASIFNIFNRGGDSISVVDIDGFLSQYAVQYEIFNQNSGIEYIEKIQELSNEENFQYYYNRLKKFSLIREMVGIGFNISDIYDDTILNPVEKDKLMKQFDEMSLNSILEIYKNKVIEIEEKFQSNEDAKGRRAGDGVIKLLDRITITPEIGMPMNSEYLSSIFRGSRKQKFYLRSSITGGGKSRHMIGDALRLSALGWYDSDKGEWIKNEFSESCLLISTEMLIEELQTPALAYIADVEEHKILRGTMNEEETKRVYQAADILERSELYFEELPNFNVRDIERVIEKNIIKNKVDYVWFDYMHSSVEMLSQLSKSSGISLREDQILYLMSDKLKGLANKHKIYLMSATQLNGDWKEAWRKGEAMDSNYLQGSKAISQKTDCAMIVLPISKKEREDVKPIIEKMGFPIIEPTHVTHVFKNRGNPEDSVKVFAKINMGTMRIHDLFCCNSENEYYPIELMEFINQDLEEENETATQDEKKTDSQTIKRAVN